MSLVCLMWLTRFHRECINRVCEAAGLKTTRKRHSDKKIQLALSDSPDMNQAGTNAILRVSTKYLSLVNSDTNETIVKHDVPKISFASGGDSVCVNFVWTLFQSALPIELAKFRALIVHSCKLLLVYLAIGNAWFCGICSKKYIELASMLRSWMWWTTGIWFDCCYWPCIRP